MGLSIINENFVIKIYMLLEINPLVLPDIGLVFWNTVAFLVLVVILGKFAWKPMLKAISDREKGIQDALNQADKVKSEMAALQNENEALLAKAREERASLISEAKATADKMVSEAKEKAKAVVLQGPLSAALSYGCKHPRRE